MMDPWVDIPENSDFSIHNIPFGIFFSEKIGSRVGVSIGDKILDLVKAFDLGIFQNFSFDRNVFDNNYLNDFISLGKLTTSSVRLHIQSELCNKNSILRKNEDAFIDKETIKMQLPVLIRDYTDFYSSIEHATNVGKMFRDPENALLPNWRHLPVGYHGRASSIVVSNTPIRRPKGQVIKPNTDMPVLEPSSKIDF